MELRPFRALRGQPRFKERRPGLWIARQVWTSDGRAVVAPLVVGLVRIAPAPEILRNAPEPPSDAVSRRVGWLVSAKTDFEPCLLIARAPLPAAFVSMRRADFSVTVSADVRYDFVRVNDYAQHVELQGMVKNVEATLATGQDLWDAARQFSVSPAAEKLPGARFKLCAIADEAVGPLAGLQAPPGILGYAFEDPVY